jgi:hypothetical protein
LDGKSDEGDFSRIIAVVEKQKVWLDHRRPFLKSMMAGAKKVGQEKKKKVSKPDGKDAKAEPATVS